MIKHVNFLLILSIIIVAISSFVVAHTTFSQEIMETATPEQTITTETTTAARAEFQPKKLTDKSKPDYTTEELILIELKKSNDRLDNIYNILWKINSRRP